jgi:hypothetical protein
MDWFKVWPSRYLNVINRITDGDLRAAFSLLLWHCLNENGLPDNEEEIAFLTGLKLERIIELRPYLARLATSKEGRLMLVPAEETIRERQEFAAKKAKAGEAGGKQKQVNKEVVKQVLAEPSTASEKLAKASTAKLCLPLASQTNKQTNKQETEIQQEREREPEQRPSLGENPLSHPLGAALLTGAGFSELQQKNLSPLNYSKLGAAITRLEHAQITIEQINQARRNWWGNSPPNFDQLADEALKVASSVNTPKANGATHYADGREKPKHLRKVVF